jgi:hypothetical protein
MLLNRSDLRNASMCVLICMAALMAAWPFSPLAFNDDWTWALTVLKLQQTGHLVYNGWSSPTVIAQAYWGLLWVKLLGFSFNVLRISSLPMAAGAVAMTYLLARRMGLNAPLSRFVTLMLGLSPVYMPMACTFMTDVPGLFFMLLSMYALLRGSQTPSTRSAIGWMLLGAIIGFVGGSSRQVVWIVPLVILPYTAWLRRRDLGFAASSIAAVIAVFTGAMAMQHWFAQQPYSIPDPPTMAYVHAALQDPKYLGWGMAQIIFTTVLLLMPVLVLVFFRWRWTQLLLALLLYFIITAHLHHTHRWPIAWMGNMISSAGVLGGRAVLPPDRPHLISPNIHTLLSVAQVLVLSMLLAQAMLWMVHGIVRGIFRGIVHGGRSRVVLIAKFVFSPAPEDAAGSAVVLTCIALLCLEMTRSVFGVAYDRHLLPLIPFLGIVLLLSFQHQGPAKMPVTAWLLLIAFGIYAIGSTQEVNALARARARAVDTLLAAGVDPTHIDAGFEYTYWLQASRTGHINDARLENPVDSFDPTKGPTPVIIPDYQLEAKLTDQTEHTAFGRVHYLSMLPPFHRTVYIDRYSASYRAHAATQPSPPMLPDSLLKQYTHPKPNRK